MKMRLFFSFITFLLVSSYVMGQSPNILSPSYQQNKKNIWTYGGNVGINFTSYGLGIDLSPQVGLKVTDDLEVGIVVNGSLQNSEYFRSLLLGVGPVASYYIGRVAYLSTSYQHYFVSQKHKTLDTTYNTNEDALYIGAGYMQQLGANVYMRFGGSYNILYKEGKSIFGSRFIPNIGVVIGL